MSTNQQAAAFGAGCFATASRARVDGREIERLHRMGRGVQTIANMTGASMEDVRKVLNPPAAAPKAVNDDWPLGECDDLTRVVIKMEAARRGVSLKQLRDESRGPTTDARNAIYAAIREFCPHVTFMQIGAIFGRDQRIVQRGIEVFKAQRFGDDG